MDLGTVLENAQSGDQRIRQEAENQLNRYASSNLGHYVAELASVLADDGRSARARQLAGLNIKNAFDAKSLKLQVQRHSQWHALEARVKDHVKQCLLRALGCASREAAHMAAIALSIVGMLELSGDGSSWDVLIPSLVQGAQQAQGPQRVAALDAIGFLCEQLAGDDLLQCMPAEQSNQLLSAVVTNVGVETVEYARSASNALLNMLAFASSNMENEGERDALMRSVLHAARHGDMEVKWRGLQSLSRVGEYYYVHLDRYIQEIFAVTAEAMRSPERKIVVSALDFWCTVAETEEALDDDERCRSFTASAMETLAPELQRIAATKPEDIEEVPDSAATMAVTTVAMAAAAVGDKMVQHFMPFVTANVTSDNWQLKDAALQLFAALVISTSADAMRPYVPQALPFVCQVMTGPENEFVTASAAWLVGAVMQHQLDLVRAADMDGIIGSLLAATKKQPTTAVFAASAVQNYALSRLDTERTDLPAVDHYAGRAIEVFIERSAQEDADEDNLRVVLFHSITNIVAGVSDESVPMLEGLFKWVVTRLQSALAHPKATPADREEQEQWAHCMVFVLASVVSRLGERLRPHCDAIMSLLLTILTTELSRAEEDTWYAVGQVAYACGDGFERYLRPVGPLLLKGLATDESEGVCRQVMGTTQDILSNVTQPTAVQMTEKIMEIMVSHLNSSLVARALKPHAIDVVGACACAAGPEFMRFIPSIMPILAAAATAAVEGEIEDEETAEITYDLRIALLGAFTAIIVALAGDPRGEPMLMSSSTVFLNFVSHLATDEDADDDTVLAAGSLLSDVICNLPSLKSTIAQQPALAGLARRFGELAREVGTDAHRESFQLMEQTF